jgi:divalent metal cation (Fe/Co/Zn/Cd) transporter
VVVLVTAIALESFSLRTAVREANKVRGEASFVGFIRRAKSPELPVILLEDVAALLGLLLALGGVGMSLITHNHYWDVAGTAAIGLLLVAVAVVLAVETKSLLLGEAASPESQRAIETALTGTLGVERLIHMKTLHLGPDELLVAAKIGVSASSSATEVAATIDAAERAVRAVEPLATAMYLEPDIYRADHVAVERPVVPHPGGH